VFQCKQSLRRATSAGEFFLQYTFPIVVLKRSSEILK